ncbi:epidermal growth factor receptor kinase substrate 8-like isoform X2 [Gigantopelta aegis]|uniref:epidermal growth factor receptor kinase substrate 8-like isoform X2 n=1 Tax=Gigantopelta aegis TaxID=1735272 RepID=UPI001B88B4F7|nr:epidermal growth factor receptor kinase substrate 8-like isoform X2 [Gigantopelta aegis]
MPGLSQRDMNGFGDYDRGPMRGTQMANGYDPYSREGNPYSREGNPYSREGRDEYIYSREDPYRREEPDLYRKVEKNGRAFNDRFSYPEDQNGSPEFRSNDPCFELDHLATFAASTRYGYIHAEDGLRKLRQMENTTGIWTMRCLLTCDRKQVTIIDNSTGEEIEKFPIQLIHEPTAIFKNDKREIYNNLILFTVIEDPKRKGSQADMHIFQSVKCRAQDIVDELLACKSGQPRPSSSTQGIPPPPTLPPPNPPRDSMYQFNDIRETLVETRHAPQYGASTRASMIARPPFLSNRGDFESGQNDLLERDVQLLNHCFDDVEKFVARLQQAAESYKELEKRRKERGNKAKKKHSDGMLSARAKPPPASDFVDIFQKFKLAFNLLAKLKAHIHDPNAPELVHFLFTPLSLIFEASRDPVHGNQNLAEQAFVPLINNDAKQLLLNCLTSKEIELWQALGKNWTITREETGGPLSVYVPRFYDGWQPAPSIIDDGPQVQGQVQVQVPLETAVLHHSQQIRSRAQEQEARDMVADMPPRRMMPFVPDETEEFRYGRQDDEMISSSQFNSRPSHFDSRPSPQTVGVPMGALGNSRVAGYQEHVEQHIDRTYEANNIKSSRRVDQPSVPMPLQPRSRGEENQAYYQELKRMGVQICEVQHDRAGKNTKELSVVKGDILHVVDNSRNWWKVRNYKGEMGHCPYTILRDLDKGSSDDRDSPREQLTGGYNNFTNLDNGRPLPPQPPPVPDFGGNRKVSKRDDSADAYTQNVSAPALPSRPPPNRDRSSPRTPPKPSQSAVKENQPIKISQRNPPDRFENSKPASAFSKSVVKKSKDPKEKTREDELHEELRMKVAHGPQTKVSYRPVYITEHSTPEEVHEWLLSKNLSPFCVQTFEGYSGHDMFHLVRKEMDRLIGREMAAKLESHLTVQKNMCGFGTVGGSELRAILQRRKEHADWGSEEEAHMGHPPDFRPITPQHTLDSSDGSEDSADHLADTGKTLRDLLIRQRKRIMGNNVFDQSPDYNY